MFVLFLKKGGHIEHCRVTGRQRYSVDLCQARSKFSWLNTTTKIKLPQKFLRIWYTKMILPPQKSNEFSIHAVFEIYSDEGIPQLKATHAEQARLE